jgi:hypothetical protein
MKKRLRMAGTILILALILAQFIRPERTNPPVDPSRELDATLGVPRPVQNILDRSCMDCHSYHTRWPWYSSLAPGSWIVAADVREAREHMNFSEWGTYTRGRVLSRLDMIISQVDKGEMPPARYRLLHPDARLDEEEKDLLCTWAETVSDSLTTQGK